MVFRGRSVSYPGTHQADPRLLAKLLFHAWNEEHDALHQNEKEEENP